MPVDRGGLGKLIVHVHADLFLTCCSQRGTKIGAVESPGIGGLTWQQLRHALLRGEVEDPDATVSNVRLRQGRDRQRLLKFHLAERGDRRDDHESQRGDPEHSQPPKQQHQPEQVTQQFHRQTRPP